MTVILVLVVVAITLASSYVVLRSQTVAAQIQGNGQLRQAARQAALVGLAVGLRRMHESTWSGVGTTYSGQLSSTQTYTVTWVQGDTALESPGGDMNEWPYRVTVRATGAASDAALGTTATWQAEAVLRLVPKALSSRPADWSAMLQYTMYQADKKPFVLEVPCQVRGSLLVRGKLEVANKYPSNSTACARYLTDLNQMRLLGMPDHRPLTGPVYLQSGSGTSSSERIDVTTYLGVLIYDVASTTLSGWTHPGTISQYRLYPGGTLYSVPVVGTTLENTSLIADPRTNPLGLFRSSGDVTLRSNVALRGTLLCMGKLDIEGQDVTCASVGQPALYGTTTPIHLPVWLISSDVTLKKDGAATIDGLIAGWGKFITDVAETSTLSIRGRLITGEFRFDYRKSWDIGGSAWTSLWNRFLLALGALYFPEWLRGEGLPPEPLFSLVPEDAPVNYHWLAPTEPIYQPAAGDGGLRWDVLRRRDFP